MADPLLPGACVCCDKELYRIETGSGGKAQVGKPREGHWRAIVQLNDGTYCTLQVCGGCREALEGRINEVWERVKESWSTGTPSAHKARYVREIIPLGVLGWQPLSGEGGEAALG